MDRIAAAFLNTQLRTQRSGGLGNWDESIRLLYDALIELTDDAAVPEADVVVTPSDDAPADDADTSAEDAPTELEATPTKPVRGRTASRSRS